RSVTCRTASILNSSVYRLLLIDTSESTIFHGLEMSRKPWAYHYADSADDSVRRSFTDDPLEYEVPTHTVEKETDASPATHLSKRTGLSRLELFPYRYFKDAKVFDRVVPGEMKPERQSKVGYPVSIQTMAGDGRSVDFGMEYEVDTYVFRRSQGCWYLSRAINLRD
ncbi:hypothetical protein, partial [Xanthomonas hortorum]|uniref:hypothetical protein n=2 Tax=Xanthomonas hortorum TaxID=56454 RepID=UPI001F40F8CF